jgi:ATP/ADP translocase
MLTSASLVAQLVAGKATRDALFLTHFGLSLLPAAMIGAALLSALSVIVMSRALTRSGPARVVPAAFAASAVLFLCEWSLSLRSERATAIAVYAHTAIFSTAIGSAFWSLVNERFDPHEAKRLVGRIASGGTLGGVIGGLLVWRASAHLSVPMMLALLAAMSVIGLWGSLRSAPAKAHKEKAPAIVTGGGTRILGDTPYLRDLALLVGAGAIVQALLDWLLSQQATETYGAGPRLLGFFALFNMVVGVLSFAAQTGITHVVLEKRGLGGTIKVQPIGVSACVVAALLAPALFVFHAILVLRVVEGVTRSSLYRSAYELFYTPLPPAKKRATKTFIDVGVDRVGTALGSGLLFAVAHVAPVGVQTKIVLFAVLAMSAAAWIVAARLQDGYVAALASSLKSGAVAIAEDEIDDLTTRKTLTETTALLDRDRLLARIEQLQREKEAKLDGAGATAFADVSDRQPGKLVSTSDLGAWIDPSDEIVTRAAALRSNEPPAIKRALVSPLTPELAPFVVPLLANDVVVREAVRALRQLAPKATGTLLDHLLDPDVDPRVRRRIPRILKVCRTQRTVSGLLLALRDPVFEVRVQVAIALGQLVDPHDDATALDRATVFDLAFDELTTGRASWSARPVAAVAADPPDDEGSPSERDDHESASLHPPKDEEAESDELRRGLAHVFAILGLALEREPLSIAYRALRAENAALRGTAFEYLEVVLPPRLREVVVPLLGDVKPAPRSRERGSNELAAELLRSHGGSLRSAR